MKRSKSNHHLGGARLSSLAITASLALASGAPAIGADSGTDHAAESIATSPPGAASRDLSKSVVLRDVMVPMRDGTKLATDIYLPSADGINPEPGRFPVLLSRTPYGKNSPLLNVPPEMSVTSLGSARPGQVNNRGYIFATQDVRGTFASEGEFEPMRNESNDGVDTVAWLNSQPWSDGRVGTFGGSYLGGVQMLLAAERPAGLVTAFSQVAAIDQFTNEWVYRDGVFAMTAAVWTPLMVNSYVARGSKEDQELLKSDYIALGSKDGMTLPPDALNKMLTSLPLMEMPINRRAPWWKKWLENRDNPKYFQASAMADRFPKIEIPILHVGGWYDLFQRNSYRSFEAISTEAKSEFARDNQRLIMGPWSHGTCVECPSNTKVNAEDLELAWMDQWFKGTHNPFFDHRVVIYVMGENRWRAEETWPLPETLPTRYYLHSQGEANSASGNGTLSTVLPKAEPVDRYLSDPSNPSPSLGGPGLTGSRAIQNPAEERGDVLAYTTPPLESDVEVTGELQATLYAASSANDTDWWVKLVDVDENGEARILAQGVARARYRISRVDPEPLTPNEIVKYEISMWATSNVFKKGHRIRVDVSSSNFPYADRNPNAFVDISKATADDFVIASQTVFHDSDRASFVDLPIIPASRERVWIEMPDLKASGGSSGASQ